MKRYLLWVVSAAVCVLGIFGFTRWEQGGTADSYHFEAVYPPSDSVPKLASQSDLVVVGTIGDLIGRESFGEDGEGLPPRAPDDPPLGVPMVYYEFDVGETIYGEASKSISLGMIDQGSDLLSVFSGKERMVLLFLQREPAEVLEKISITENVYSVVGGENGIFEIIDDRHAVPQSVGVFETPTKTADGQNALRLDTIISQTRDTKTGNA